MSRKILPETKKKQPSEHSRYLAVVVIWLVLCSLVAVSALVISLFMSVKLLQSLENQNSRIEELVNIFDQRLDNLTSEVDMLDLVRLNSTSELQTVHQQQQLNRFTVNDLRQRFSFQLNQSQQMEMGFQIIQQSMNNRLGSLESFQLNSSTELQKVQQLSNSAVSDLRQQISVQHSQAQQMELNFEIRLNQTRLELADEIQRETLNRLRNILGYVNIPPSNTYMRLGRKLSTWEDAKADCEERGERMLILETAAKSTWVVNQLNVIGSSGSLLSSEWTCNLWIGGKYTSGEWRWYNGTQTFPITQFFWHSGQWSQHMHVP